MVNQASEDLSKEPIIGQFFHILLVFIYTLVSHPTTPPPAVSGRMNLPAALFPSGHLPTTPPRSRPPITTLVSGVSVAWVPS